MVEQDFKVDAYLGRWYEQRRDAQCLFETGICETANYSLNDDGNIAVHNNEYVESKKGGSWGGAVGVATVVDPSKDEGYLTVKFNIFAPAGDYKVVETDYESYTVIYTCFGLPSLVNIEYAWILTRDLYPSDEVMDKAYAAIAAKLPKYDIRDLKAYPQGAGALSTGEDCPYDTEPKSSKSAQGCFANFLQ